MTVIELAERMPDALIRDIRFPCDGAAILAMRQTVDLVEFGTRLGLEAVPHNRQGDLVWDVKPVGPNNGEPRARSQTAEKFPLHTDASFEPSPPRFFMLQVLQPDRFGGGLQSFVPVHEVIQRLGSHTYQQLEQEQFMWRVPPEFQKDVPENKLPVFFDGTSEVPAMRYREECMVVIRNAPHPSLRENLKNAVLQARSLRHRPAQHEIVLVDNWHVLHSRNEVRDPDRHLQRVRFK